MSRRLLPMLDRVLIRRVKPTPKTVGGIMLPEKSQPSANLGVVVAVGPGRRSMGGDLIPMTVKEGDHVLLSDSFNGTDVTVDNLSEQGDLTLFREDDILGVVKE